MTYTHSVVDSYTGLRWCGAGLHLLDDGNRAPNGRCRPCDARKRRAVRARTAQAREGSVVSITVIDIPACASEDGALAPLRRPV